jgi:predicted RNase H-like nuclease
MPMATVPIRGRRKADDEVSRNFWKQKCGTHSPSESRPGKIGAALANGFLLHGFRLATIPGHVGSFAKSLIEVYPHPALVVLTAAEVRLRYKLSKASKHWPDLSSVLRRERVIAELSRIEARLRVEFDGIALPPIQPDSPSFAIKAREDVLDALVSAWVGTQYRAGLANPFGDETAAIWIPGQQRLRLEFDSMRNRPS